jgi:hypothetical protein
VLPVLQPDTDSVLDAGYQPRLSTADNLVVLARCLHMLSEAGGALLPDWSPSSGANSHWLAARPDISSTPVLCALVPVLVQMQLLLDAQQILLSRFAIPLALSHFTAVLHDRCSNPIGSCSTRVGDAVGVPAPDSSVQDTGLHLLRLHLHHLVPAMLYACKHPVGQPPTETRQHQCKTLLAMCIRLGVDLAIGECLGAALTHLAPGVGQGVCCMPQPRLHLHVRVNNTSSLTQTVQPC